MSSNIYSRNVFSREDTEKWRHKSRIWPDPEDRHLVDLKMSMGILLHLRLLAQTGTDLQHASVWCSSGLV